MTTSVRRCVLALAVGALVLSGCSKKNEPQPLPTFNTQVSASADPSTAPTGEASAGPSATPSKAEQTYPTDGKIYAQTLLNAWSSKNKTRMEQLAAQSAILQMNSHQPKASWNTFLSCTNMPDNKLLCKFRNTDGDEAEVTLDKNQIGHAAAVIDVVYYGTDFPTDPGSYVSLFMSAWINGNTDRMRAMSNSTVVNFFNGKTKPSGGTAYPAPESGGHYKVEYDGLPSGSGAWDFDILKSNLGKGGAITSVKNH